jgi:hypothetical protein
MAQKIDAIIGNKNMSRVFTNAAGTESSYNNLTDTTTTTALGLSLPNQTISYVCGTVTSGSGLWRIISSTTNLIHRQGICSLVSYVDPAECYIPSLKIQSDMLFQILPVPVAGAGTSNVLALITSNRGIEAFHTASPAPDGVSSNLVSIISGLTVGNLLFGSTIQQVKVAGETGMVLNNVTCTDASGGTQFTGYGNVRLPTAGGKSLQTNGVYDVSIGVQKGWNVLCNVTKA